MHEVSQAATEKLRVIINIAVKQPQWLFQEYTYQLPLANSPRPLVRCTMLEGTLETCMGTGGSRRITWEDILLFEIQGPLPDDEIYPILRRNRV